MADPVVDGSGSDAPVAAPEPWWAAPALPVIVVLLPVLAVGVSVLVHLGVDPLVGADYSLLEVGTRSVWEGHALLGPYSRFRWNHPGPALWYWNAPFYALAGQRAGGLSLAALVLNGLGLGWTVHTVGRIRDGRRPGSRRRWPWCSCSRPGPAGSTSPGTR